MQGLNTVKTIGVRLGNKTWGKLCEAEIATCRKKSEIVRAILAHFFLDLEFLKPPAWYADLEIVKQKDPRTSVKQKRRPEETSNKHVGSAETVKRSRDRENVKQEHGVVKQKGSR